MLGRLIDRLLHEEEEEEVEKREEDKERGKGEWDGWAAAVLLVALAARLVYLFWGSGPENAGAGWYGDTYHHWQIGYLSYKIGLKKGFLRLWDFKGMEYYWGILHPLLLAFLFWLTGSVDVVITRLLSLVCGSLSIVFLYLLAKRYWNRPVALAAAFLAALNPVVVFNDASGMVEPLGLVLLLAGVWFWPKRPALTGLLWGLAAWARAEAWLFSLGMMGAVFLTRQKAERKVVAFLAWSVVMVFYMKVLLDRTGNAIYPFWWNFIALAVGKWQTRPSLTVEQLAVRPVVVGVFLVAVVFLVFLVWRRPRGFLLLALGGGATAFITGFMGLTAYLSSYERWFWMIRFFVFPYVFLGLLLAIGVFWTTRRWREAGVIGGVVWAGLILGLQWLWQPIWAEFKKTYVTWERKKAWAETVKRYYDGGTVLIPEGEMDFTYTLVRFAGIGAENLLGQMYTPFVYPPLSEHSSPFERWEEERRYFWEWVEKEGIRWLVIDEQSEPYKGLVERERERLEKVAVIPQSRYSLWRVRNGG